jgi:hypothetical protein
LCQYLAVALAWKKSSPSITTSNLFNLSSLFPLGLFL